MKKITPITLAIFKNLFAAICDEMGVTLARTSFSPNIKERRDFSCALFDAKGDLVAQAAHIPVHLGSMPLSVKAALKSFRLQAGDTVILNDPYRGGTHLPDITLVSPVFVERRQSPAFFVANRAHHADVGGQSPGSMPLAMHLESEGVVIPPTLFRHHGRLNRSFLRRFLREIRNPDERRADLLAQEASNSVGTRRLQGLVSQYGLRPIQEAMIAFQEYETRITRQAINLIPPGHYHFKDFLDDDGLSRKKIRIVAKIHVQRGKVTVDFSKTDRQVVGPINCPYAVTLSAVAYVFRSLVLSLTGEDCLSLTPINVKTRPGSVVDASYPAPVAGGNVETSQRVVDVLFGALAKALPRVIPAASQGTMNNFACGTTESGHPRSGWTRKSLETKSERAKDFSYYETLAGGMGARPNKDGIDAIHTHMTNTRNTPIEAMEAALPMRITQYHIRRGSGGTGRHRGGDGVVREYQFLKEAHISLLTERRSFAPYGLRGGKPGRRGINWLISSDKKKRLPAKAELVVKKGDRIRIETPGGGGWGKP